MEAAKFSRSYSRTELRRSGPKIRVTIGHPSAALRAARESGAKLKQPFTVTALIDTGAARTVVNPNSDRTPKGTGYAYVQERQALPNKLIHV